MPPLLAVRELSVHFPLRTQILRRLRGEIRAVDRVSFEIATGETLGLVGESGSGKSTLGRAILRLLQPTAGRVYLGGTELLGLDAKPLRQIRQDMQIIFQDPHSSFDPHATIAESVAEPLVTRLGRRQAELEGQVVGLLEQVGLDASFLHRYPVECSGGQIQRIAVARALAPEPRLIVCDEAVSSLDVSTQAQVINLLAQLQADNGFSYLFISHDLSVVRHISDRIFVMYLGNIVEAGPADQIYSRPMHPYSQMLLSAVPRPDPDARRVRTARLRAGSPPGTPAQLGADDLPSPLNKPSGCAFRTRCPIAKPACAEAVPPLEERNGRQVACPYAE